MIVVRVYAGLGNQMFQYAMGRALSLAKGEPLILDLSWFKRSSKKRPRPFSLHVFPLQCHQGKKSDLKRFYPKKWLLQKALRAFGRSVVYPENYIKEPSFEFWPKILELPSDCYLHGFWQSEKYFLRYAEEIRRAFIFPCINDSKNLELLEKISEQPHSVSVHIRRGDYLLEDGFVVCSHSYYKKAFRLLEEKFGKLHYFFFSDEPEWVEKSFKMNNMTVVSGNTGHEAYRDMQLMSLCRHHIIANSSFSWWGAWLGGMEGITIAPGEWFAKSNGLNAKDIYCANWLVM